MTLNKRLLSKKFEIVSKINLSEIVQPTLCKHILSEIRKESLPERVLLRQKNLFL